MKTQTQAQKHETTAMNTKPSLATTDAADGTDQPRTLLPIRGIRAIRGFLVCAVLLAAARPLGAADFQITGAYLRADGRLVLQHPATTNAYYILYHGDLTNLTQTTDVKLGVNGTGELVGVNIFTNAAYGFFRAAEVPLTQPLDSDGDGWNDVDEITVGSNPLDPRSRPPITVVAAPPVTLLLPANVGSEGLAWNTAVAQPPVSLLLPANEGAGGLPPNTTLASPPLALLLPTDAGPEGLAWNTALAQPPVALLLPASLGAAGLTNNTVLGQPPVRLQIGTP